jgi:hypothetical protein
MIRVANHANSIKKDPGQNLPWVPKKKKISGLSFDSYSCGFGELATGKKGFAKIYFPPKKDPDSFYAVRLGRPAPSENDKEGTRPRHGHDANFTVKMDSDTVTEPIFAAKMNDALVSQTIFLVKTDRITVSQRIYAVKITRSTVSQSVSTVKIECVAVSQEDFGAKMECVIVPQAIFRIKITRASVTQAIFTMKIGGDEMRQALNDGIGETALNLQPRKSALEGSCTSRRTGSTDNAPASWSAPALWR